MPIAEIEVNETIIRQLPELVDCLKGIKKQLQIRNELKLIELGLPDDEEDEFLDKIKGRP